MPNIARRWVAKLRPKKKTHENGARGGMDTRDAPDLVLIYEHVEVKPRHLEPSERQTRPLYSTSQIKNGVVDGLGNIPTEIFIGICSYLQPTDIISLSRSNKGLRNLLMHRSARHIWLDSMSKMEGLPPCPSDMNEPSYLVLMLGDSCMECGQPGLHDVYEALRVRLCLSCSFERLAPVPRIPLELQDLVHKSTGEFYEKWYGGLPPPVVYSLRNEVSEVEEKIKELVKMGDQVALESWKKERSSAVRERTKETEELQRFLYKREATRRPEPVGPRYICCSACG